MSRPQAAVIDERGSLCPAPIIALGRALRSLPAGAEITLIADDPVALSDVPAWCRLVGAALVDVDRRDAGELRFVVLLP